MQYDTASWSPSRMPVNEAPDPVRDGVPVVLVADDHAVVRGSIRELVKALLGEVVFVEAEDGEQLIHAARTHPLRLALVGLNMPGMRRGERLAELALRHPQVPLVVISALASPDAVRRALDVATVHAFIPRHAPATDIRLAVEAAMQGVRLPFAQRLPPPRRPYITPRMKEVHRLLRQGMGNRLIASTLGITEGTVKNYVSDLFRALKVTNRSQAALHNPDAL